MGFDVPNVGTTVHIPKFQVSFPTTGHQDSSVGSGEGFHVKNPRPMSFQFLMDSLPTGQFPFHQVLRRKKFQSVRRDSEIQSKISGSQRSGGIQIWLLAQRPNRLA